MCNIIVIGTGISGLMASINLARLGAKVTMISYMEAMRSASCMAQGGINAAESRENDSPKQHFIDTIEGGAWLADQVPVFAMCEFAPKIIAMYDRLGVVFNRHKDGTPDTRYFGGTKLPRTHYADTTTGYQLLSALDSQARRYEAEGRIQRIIGKDFVSALIENGCCYGCITQDIYSMKLEVFTGDALIIATGGYAGIYGWATTAALSNGAAVGQLFSQGLPVGNPEFVQFHPTSMAEGDKPRLISESARGDGGRIWVPRNGKPWYFLEEMYPDKGNLVTRDIASRAIYKVVMEMNLGVEGKKQVYLDIAHLPTEVKAKKLSNIIELYKKYSGEDPENVPMRVFPSPHYSMGGLYVDKHHRTEISGLYACGECDYLYHGANRLGGNSLLSATYSGYVAANAIINDYNSGIIKRANYAQDTPWIAAISSKWEQEMESYCYRQGRESLTGISTELGKILTANAGIVRRNTQLKEAVERINGLKERWKEISLTDKGKWANSSIIGIRKLHSSILLAEAIVQAALCRNESRGSHYKPEFPKRDDMNWLKTTIASYSKGQIKIQYKPIEASIMNIKP